MKRIIIIFFLGLLFSLGVPLLISFVPLLVDFNNQNISQVFAGTRRYIDYYMIIILFSLTVIFTYVSYYINEMRNDEKSILDSYSNLKQSIDHLSALLHVDGGDGFYAVDKSGLYQTMASVVKTSDKRMDMMYLNDIPPDQLRNSTHRDSFYSSFNEIISKGTIPVKRIVLFTKENKAWINSYAREHKNSPNFSLYIIKTKPMPPVSIQIIDNRFVILISIFKDSLSGMKKHLIFDSANMALVFQTHYNKILEKSVPIILNGHLNESNYKKYFG